MVHFKPPGFRVRAHEALPPTAESPDFVRGLYILSCEDTTVFIDVPGSTEEKLLGAL